MESVEESSDLKWSDICIDPIDRWSVFYRLQQLSIPCRCDRGQPLQVQVNGTTAAIQLWSAIKQVTASRKEHLEWLERCWEV